MIAAAAERHPSHNVYLIASQTQSVPYQGLDQKEIMYLICI
jgi:hypothetical protein